MQCPKCGAITSDDALDTRYCSNCGASLHEPAAPTVAASGEYASELPTVQIGNQPAGEVTALDVPQATLNASSLPVTPALPAVGSVPTMDAGWSEFSSATLPVSTPASAEPTYPSSGGAAYTSPNAYPQAVPGDSMVPGAYTSPNMYIQQPASGIYPPQPAPGGYPYPYAPGSMPPLPPAPKRKSPLLAIVLSVLVVLLIVGGVFAGLAIGLAHSKTATTQTTPTATATPNAQQLYQQITSQNPDYIDSLQDPTTSSWFVGKASIGECDIQNDGLHIHSYKTDYFYYCTSGEGEFNDFAFQVDMKILSGEAGGIIFRSDTKAGNFYVFYASSDGNYRIGLEQNGQPGLPLRAGPIGSFNPSQKNTLAVIAQRNTLDFYVNQQFFVEIQDSTYSNGTIGMLSDNQGSPAEVVYTNAKFWPL